MTALKQSTRLAVWVWKLSDIAPLKKVNDIERFRNDSGCIAQKGKCPCCNMIVIDYIDGYGDVDSCFHCGQALDWSDEE